MLCLQYFARSTVNSKLTEKKLGSSPWELLGAPHISRLLAAPVLTRRHVWARVKESVSGFDKRQIVRSCPRPDVDCVYTPTLDKFLPDLFPKCKAEDKALRKRQDLLSDLAGPLAMIYELVSQTREDTEQLDTFLILSFATKGLQLLDNVNSHSSNKRREHVSSKIGQKYTFLPNEKLENNGKELFR